MNSLPNIETLEIKELPPLPPPPPPRRERTGFLKQCNYYDSLPLWSAPDLIQIKKLLKPIFENLRAAWRAGTLGPVLQSVRLCNLPLLRQRTLFQELLRTLTQAELLDLDLRQGRDPYPFALLFNFDPIIAQACDVQYLKRMINQPWTRSSDLTPLSRELQHHGRLHWISYLCNLGAIIEPRHHLKLAFEKNEAVVPTLLASMVPETKTQKSALFWAIEAQVSTSTLKCLVAYGCEVAVTDHKGFTPLARALLDDPDFSLASFQLLWSKLTLTDQLRGFGPDDDTYLHLALTSCRNQEIWEFLLVTDPCLVTVPSGVRKEPPLMTALKKNIPLQFVQFLMDPVTLKQLTNSVAVIMAACWNDGATIRALVMSEGWHWWCRDDQLTDIWDSWLALDQETALFLIAAAPLTFLNRVTWQGCSFLHQLVSLGSSINTALLEALLERGVDCLGYDIYGNTPLHWACYLKRPAKIVLRLAVEPSLIIQENYDGLNPLQLLVSNLNQDHAQTHYNARLIFEGLSAVVDRDWLPLLIPYYNGVKPLAEIFFD